MSAGPFMPVGPFLLAGLWVPTNILMPINPLAPTSLVLFFYAGLPVIQDMTKPFFIRTSIIAIDNTIAQMYPKDII